MKAINTTDIITGAISQALETMTFLDAMVADGEDETQTPSTIVTAKIDFSGPINGTIQILAGLDFARTAAENISNQDDLTEEQCIDAIKELANVTCGLVLPVAIGSQVDVFDVTVPQSSCTQDQSHWEQFVAQDDVVLLDVEGWPLATKLTVN